MNMQPNMFAKRDMTEKELFLLHSELENRKKTTSTAFLLWLFLGGLGVHRFYARSYAIGVVLLLTLGGLGLGALVDGLFVSSMVRKYNERVERELIVMIMNSRKSEENPS